MRMRNPKDKDEVISSCSFIYSKTNEFNNNNPIHLEIGMGKGSFILQKAIENPNINFIGVEKYSSVASIAIKKINEYELDNLKVLIKDAKDLPELLNKKIDTIYLNFSDPWPKKRHAKRRLTSPEYLSVYDKLFKNKNHIVLKTDNLDLFNYSLEMLEQHKYEIKELSYDLHSTNIYNIKTEYETKFSEQGIKIKYLDAYK